MDGSPLPIVSFPLMNRLFCLLGLVLCVAANASLPPPASSDSQRADIDALRAAYSVRPEPYKLAPATARRLADIWKTGSPDKRLEALHDWMRELMRRNAGPEECAAVLSCAHHWGGGHFCELERNLLYRRLAAFWNAPDADPSSGPGGRVTTIAYPQSPVGRWLSWVENEGIVDWSDIAVFVDAVNGRTEGAPYGNPRAKEITAIAACRIWNDPKTYAPLIQAKGSPWSQLKVRRALRDPDSLLDTHAQRGIRRWRYTWGKDLPPAIRRGMRAMRERRDGKLPGPDVLADMKRLAADMEPDMLGFLPRCRLAVDPTCLPWQALDAPKASLFSMPDSSAPFLPQWDDSLLGRPSTFEEDVAALAGIARDAEQSETLPALLAFSLSQADAALPDGYSRAWMNVDGYDTFRIRLDIICKQHGIDIIVDESGPRFSRDDAELQTASRRLALALHRCILQMAILERRGDDAALKRAAGELAAVLNERHLWPLLLNEYELRGIPPETYVSLIAAHADAPELLRAFTEAAEISITYSAAKRRGNGTVAPPVLAGYMRDALILRRSLAVPEVEREEAAARWLAEDIMHPDARLGTAQYVCAHGYAKLAALHEAIPDALISGDLSYTGFRMVQQALEDGDISRAQAVFARMSAQPGAFLYAETHLAHALLARRAKDEKTAEREEKNALILAAVAIRRGSYGSYFAFKALLDAGLLEQAERMQLLFRSRPENRTRKEELARAFAKRRLYDAAAFQLEELLHTACVNATPSSHLGTQADIVAMRALADGYRASALLEQGKKAEGERLLAAAYQAARNSPATLTQLETNCKNRGGDLRPGSPAAEEARQESSLASDENGPWPGFTSPAYTWHFLESDGRVETAEAAIESAWYEDFSMKKYRVVSSKGAEETAWHRRLLASSRILLRHPGGRLQRVSLLDIAPEDIDNIVDWKEKNAIRTWTRRYPQYGTEPPGFDAMIVEAGQGDAFKGTHKINGADVSDGKYVVFRLASGGILRLYVNQLIDDDKPFIEDYAKRTASSPRLRAFSSWKAAQIDAECRGTTAEAYMLGPSGGPEDNEFKRTILDNPGKISELNAQKSIVVCRMDDQGRWDAAGREVMAEVGPWIESIFPPGSAPEDNIYRTGFLVRKQYGGFRIYNILYPKPLPKVEALLQSIRRNDADKVRAMLDADPSLARARGFAEVRSMLAEAIVRSTPDVVAALLDAGADPRSLDHEGKPMLALASQYGKNDTASLLLARGADAHAEYGENRSGFGSIVRMRPIGNVGVNAELAETLLRAGASAILPCRDGQTPLVVAAGIDPNGKKPELLDSLPLIDCYIRHGADINARDEHGNTPLSEAVRTKHGTLAAELIRRGADPNLPGPDGRPLLLAASTVETARALLDGGADIDATAACSFETALSQCFHAPQNHIPLIRMLLERGARHDITPSGRSFLHGLGRKSWAAIDYRDPDKREKTRLAILEAARLLIEHGADVNARNDEGKTLLDELSAPTGRHGDSVAHPDFLALLRRHGARSAAEQAGSGNAPAPTPLAPQE